MRYWLLGSLALLIASSIGCACGDMCGGLGGGHHGHGGGNCGPGGCGPGGCGPFGACDNRCGRTYSGIEGSYAGHHHGYQEATPQGPPIGAVTYPYYTHRGPRDFLMANPPPIGP